MNLINFDAIYKFYKKNLSIWSISKFYGKIFYVLAGILSFTWVAIIFLYAKKLVLFWIIFCILYISSMISIAIPWVILRKQLEKELKIKNGFDELLNQYRYRKFIKFIEEDLNIKTEKQKESLLDIIKDKSEDTKINTLWVPSLFLTLVIPIWSAAINNSMKLKNISTFLTQALTVIIFIIIIVAICKYCISDIFINIFNLKSMRYKNMAFLLQQNLIYNHYNKLQNELSGEIVIRKL